MDVVTVWEGAAAGDWRGNSRPWLQCRLPRLVTLCHRTQAPHTRQAHLQRPLPVHLAANTARQKCGLSRIDSICSCIHFHMFMHTFAHVACMAAKKSKTTDWRPDEPTIPANVSANGPGPRKNVMIAASVHRITSTYRLFEEAPCCIFGARFSSL